jgi:predicted nucleic acid-binding protein
MLMIRWTRASVDSVTTVIIVDTGVVYALADRRDAHHAACVRWLVSVRTPMIVPPPVIAEACYLIGRHLGAEAEAAFLDALGPGQAFTLGDLLPVDIGRMAELVRQYGDLPLGGTDAAVISVAERLGVAEIATVDRRHFSVVRPRHVSSLVLLPVDL